MLRTDLDHAAGFLRGVHHRTAFDDVVSQRFLGIYVLAVRASGQEHIRVPMVGSADDDGVHVLALDNAAKIADHVDPARRLARLFEIRHRRGALGGIDVAKRDDIDIGHEREIFEIAASHAAQPHERDADSFVRRRWPWRLLAPGVRRPSRSHSGRHSEKLAACGVHSIASESCERSSTKLGKSALAPQR